MRLFFCFCCSLKLYSAIVLVVILNLLSIDNFTVVSKSDVNSIFFIFFKSNPNKDKIIFNSEDLEAPIVLILEFMTRIRRYWSLNKSMPMTLKLIDVARIGLLYGLLMEGFKLL